MRIREDTLHDALHSDDPAERIRAVQHTFRHKRTDLLPDLVALLGDDEVGSFVEEGLPQFAESTRDRLRVLLHDETATSVARQRAAGVLAFLNDSEAVPFLLAAIESPDTNQRYLRHLRDLAPEALTKKVVSLLRERRGDAMMTTEPRRADYFAKLIAALGALDRADAATDLLQDLRDHARDWRVQRAAGDALAAGKSSNGGGHDG